MGFCDAALGEDKVLLVYYLWHGKPYTASLLDRVCIPAKSQAPLHCPTEVISSLLQFLRCILISQELSSKAGRSLPFNTDVREEVPS